MVMTMTMKMVGVALREPPIVLQDVLQGVIPRYALSVVIGWVRLLV
jgi:hypothetical protein